MTEPIKLRPEAQWPDELLSQIDWDRVSLALYSLVMLDEKAVEGFETRLRYMIKSKEIDWELPQFGVSIHEMCDCRNRCRATLRRTMRSYRAVDELRSRTRGAL